MKNRYKQLLCMGMAVLMTLSSMPVAAWAETVTPEEVTSEQSGLEGEISTPGETSAEDFEYKELEDGTLDFIANDHAPHAMSDKARPMANSAFPKKRFTSSSA